MSPSGIRYYAAVLFALLAALFLGYFDLHTDDTGVEVGLVLIACAVLAFIVPRHAWIWSIALAESIVLVESAHGMLAGARPGLASPASFLLLALFLGGVGAAGAGAGYVARRIAFSH